MQPEQITTPHIITPLQWTSWATSIKDNENELLATIDSDVTISSLLWDDVEDPLLLKSKPYFLGTSSSSDDEANVRLDLPPATHLKQLGNKDALSFKVFRLNDFVISPEDCWNDAALSSCDPVTGKQLSLTSEQRKTLKSHGQINVPSRRFKSSTNSQLPQYHTWQVARGLYSGTSTILNDFLQFGCGVALDHLMLATASLATLRIASRTLFDSILKVYDGVTHLIQTHDQPKYSPEAIDMLVDEAKDRYIYSQLDKTSSGGWMLPLQKGSSLYYDNNMNYVRELWSALQSDGEWTVGLERSINEDWGAAKLALKRLKFLRQSTKSQNHADVIQGDEDDHLARKSTISAQLFFKKHNEKFEMSQLEQWVDTVGNDKSLGPYAQYEAEHIRADEIESLLRQEDELTTISESESKMKDMCSQSPIMALSSEWRRKQLNKIRTANASKSQTTFEQRLIERLNENQLDRMSVIRLHMNEFNEKYSSNLRRKLKNIRIPLTPVTFHVLQFNPRNWDHNGRHLEVKVSLNKPWWRLRHAFLSFWSTTKEVIGGSYHYLLHGSLSFRALLSPQPFCALNNEHMTPTLMSRLTQFWFDLSVVRQNFEAEPDSGLIGKSVARIFLRLYLKLKASIGTTWIVAFMTVGTIVATLISTSFVLFGPVLGLFWALSGVARNTFIYDFTLESALRRGSDPEGFGKYHPLPEIDTGAVIHYAVSPVLKITIVAPYLMFKGAIIFLFAIASSCLVFPTLAILRVAWSGFRSSLRSFRDLLTWPILIATARSPATNKNTWLAYRIHGPGLASEQYFRLPLWSAKLSVRLKLDMVRLDLHHKLRSIEFMGPYDAYVNIFKDLYQLGIKSTPVTENPLCHAQTMSNKFFDSRTDSLLPRRTERFPAKSNPLNVWSNDAFVSMSGRTELIHWNPLTVESVDTMIFKDAGKYKKAYAPSLLQKIVDSIIPTYATWLSQKRYREFLLYESVSLPMHTSGRFRLSRLELDNLWKFTLHQVDVYNNTIHKELEDIAEKSLWLSKEDSTKIAAMYNAKNESNALVAYQLLCSLFGETAMIETLEDIDETLVLDAGIAPEDRHLLMWMDEGDVGLLLPSKK